MAVTLGENDKTHCERIIPSSIKDLYCHETKRMTGIEPAKSSLEGRCTNHYAPSAYRSGITLPLLRLERKSLHLTMTNMNNNF